MATHRRTMLSLQISQRFEIHKSYIRDLHLHQCVETLYKVSRRNINPQQLGVRSNRMQLYDHIILLPRGSPQRRFNVLFMWPTGDGFLINQIPSFPVVA
jgi:hypothetical protein